MAIYLRGLLMGLAYVAPIGAQNLYIINTALSQPRKKAFLTALITIFFDISLSLACFFGIGALMEALPWLRKCVLAIGSLLIIWMGIGLIRSKSSLSGGRDTNVSLLKTAAIVFTVTWINPQALIDGTMLLGAASATLAADETLYFVFGFTSASVIWFSGVTAAISLFSGKITDKLLRIINIVCGAVMIFYGLKLVYSFLQLMGWV
jgi:L-lysine exporter family protein LysE/ArgO